MKERINRSICLAQWKNGDFTFAMSRFVWRNDIMCKHHYFYTNKLSGFSIDRIDAVLNNYRGKGVQFSKNDDRVMITQAWDDNYLMDGETIDRSQYKTFADMIKEYYPQMKIKEA